MEMPAAMSPYSTAVAPDSSLANFTSIVISSASRSVRAAGNAPGAVMAQPVQGRD
jgi:hypothetical protein